MRFLIDENVNRRVLSFLVELGHEAKSSPKGLSNGSVLAEANRRKSILITHDKDFADVKMLFVAHQGIILLRILPEDFETIKSRLSKLLEEKPSQRLFKNQLFQLFQLFRYPFIVILEISD